MSFLHRLLGAFRPIRYAGRDLEGNKFYEYPSALSGSHRTKRTVQYKNPEDVWHYIGGGRRLPVQWSMWLSHTRRHPPTPEELQQDLERQQRVRANAAMIEARDEVEREARLRIERGLAEENAQRRQINRPQPVIESESQSQPQKRDK